MMAIYLFTEVKLLLNGSEIFEIHLLNTFLFPVENFTGSQYICNERWLTEGLEVIETVGRACSFPAGGHA